jgi:DNA repair exonuclease SbcCD nuclease subunit
MAERASDYDGLLIIGDPHLEGRQPGFRKDDYPRVILDKLGWCLNYAKEYRLLPAIPGDLFDKPRDNPTWMLRRLIEMLGQVECIGLYGNHDCADPILCEHDSLSLLVAATRIQLVDVDQPWRGYMNGRLVIVGGSSYRHPIPNRFDPQRDADTGEPLVIWLTHHDIIVPGYEEQGRFQPREIDGIDLVINGHIHRRLDDVQVGRTLWITPGNISRRSRSDATRDHMPSVLRIDVGLDGFERRFVEVPHQAFDEVFHDMVVDGVVDASDSAFVKGLAELQARRTQSGAGLMTFLEQNLDQFDAAVANEVLVLAKEVTLDVESRTKCDQ